MHKFSPSSLFISGRFCLLPIAGLALALGACSADRVVTGSTPSNDYRVRHPIVLANDPKIIDIFPVGGRLDEASRARVAEFVSNFRQTGQGRLMISLPQSGPSATAARAALDPIRRAIATAGVHDSVLIDSYPVTDPTLASPVRISAMELTARVASRCGEWPDDLASGGSVAGWQNRPYWNMGCASQSALAAQVADPRDLVTPRAEQPGDVQMRLRAIGKVREGADPGTEWRVKNTEISNVGAAP